MIDGLRKRKKLTLSYILVKKITSFYRNRNTNILVNPFCFYGEYDMGIDEQEQTSFLMY